MFALRPISPSRWRNRTFVVTFVVAVLPWLAFVGWVTWLVFFPVLNWIERQNAFVQELLALVAILAWFFFLVIGAFPAAMLADHVAGPEPYTSGQTHGQHAAWRRPDR